MFFHNTPPHNTKVKNNGATRFTNLASQGVHWSSQRLTNVLILWQFWIAVNNKNSVSVRSVDPRHGGNGGRYLDGVWAAQHLMKRAMMTTNAMAMHSTAYQ